jgi:nitrogen fixation/metabolism regulation signal transduction histidine kinase
MAERNVFNYLDSKGGDKTNVNTMSSLKWLFSVIDRPCPNRKIGKFRHLKKLNGKTITIYDIFRITGIRNKYDFIVNEVEEKVKEKLRKMEANQKRYDERRNKTHGKKSLPEDKNVVMDKHYYLERYKQR